LIAVGSSALIAGALLLGAIVDSLVGLALWSALSSARSSER
jgi:hypothetical protein